MRAALAFSLWVILVAGAWAGPWGDLAQSLAKTRNASEAITQIQASPLTARDPEVLSILSQKLSDEDSATMIESLVQLRARVEQTPSSEGTPKVDAKRIKSSPLYRDPGVTETSNWLSNALDRLRNIHLNRPDTPNVPPMAIGPWISFLMWGAIFLVVALLLFVAVKHIRWRGKLRRKASAVLEDSEPDRTLDEWLAEADALIAQGRYREAVRALYLACLLRFDEANIARFQRGQTNWEHLSRIEASPLLPPGLDFRPATRLFDRVWYGQMVRGTPDVEELRAWYLQVTDAVRRKAA